MLELKGHTSGVITRLQYCGQARLLVKNLANTQPHSSKAILGSLWGILGGPPATTMVWTATRDAAIAPRCLAAAKRAKGCPPLATSTRRCMPTAMTAHCWLINSLSSCLDLNINRLNLAMACASTLHYAVCTACLFGKMLQLQALLWCCPVCMQSQGARSRRGVGHVAKWCRCSDITGQNHPWALNIPIGASSVQANLYEKCFPAGGQHGMPISSSNLEKFRQLSPAHIKEMGRMLHLRKAAVAAAGQAGPNTRPSEHGLVTQATSQAQAQTIAEVRTRCASQCL